MNDDYLWDRTGEPDPEIEQLEELLGTLRHQPRPLELPRRIRPEGQPRYFALLAIAATIALMILAAGLWVRIHRTLAPGQSEMANELPPLTGIENIPPMTLVPPAGPMPVGIVPKKGTPRGAINPRRRKPSLPGNSFARNRNRQPSSVARQDDLSVAQLDEVRAAKEQLMLALRLASAKLNFAQRKTQGPPTPGTIRNQHKVG